MATLTHRLPFIAEGQAQPHVTHNAALDLIDAALQRVALSASMTSPPPSPADGAVYLLPTGASGWGDAGPGDLAIWSGGLWHRVAPVLGWRWHVADEGRARVFDGVAWRPGDIAGPAGSTLGLAIFERVIDLSGASVTVPGLLPNRASIIGVTSWTIQTVTGATSYSVGRSVGASEFGGSLGVAAGSSNVGGVGQFFTYAPGDVVVTAAGGNFTGGRVGLSVAAILPGPGR